MISSKQIKDWLKPGVPEALAWYSGSLGDGSLEKTVTVYPFKGITATLRRMDGRPGYRNQAFTVLIRWSRNSEESEAAAFKIYNQIMKLPGMLVDMHSGIPIYLGVEDGVHEFVINFDYVHKEA